jgi:tyrosyl-tRNA synthetase
MGQQRQDESRRWAQHILAKEVVELAHGAAEAKKAETAHKEAFSHGTNTFSLGALRNTLASMKPTEDPLTAPFSNTDKQLIAYKKAYAASSTTQAIASTTHDRPKDYSADVITLPLTMLQPGSFPRILHAAGLASSKSEAHRLIASKGAYVVVPNSGSLESPTALQWVHIDPLGTADPNHFLVDWEALILRVGKSKIQICRVVTDKQFEAEGLTVRGLGRDQI